MEGDQGLQLRVLGFGRSAGVVGASNLEWRLIKGASTVVAGYGRGTDHGNDVTSSWRELGQAVWLGLVMWRACTRVQARGRGTDG